MHTEKYPVKTVVITGAFSYTGKYATRLLLNREYKIRTVTFHPERENEFGGKVEVFPCNFESVAFTKQPTHVSSLLFRGGASLSLGGEWRRL
jgi:hypothetical protein